MQFRMIGIGMGLIVGIAACSSGHRTSTSSGSGSGSGTSSKGCDTYLEGDHRCKGGTGSDQIEVCKNGSWVYETSCSCAVKVGDPRKPPYDTTCKYDGEGSAVCSYAGVSCLTCDRGMTCSED